MRRWLFTSALGVAAAAAVVLVPRFVAPAPTVVPQTGRAPTGSGAGTLTAPVPVAEGDGPVRFAARLDQSAVLRGDDAQRYLVLTLSADPDPEAKRLPVDVALVVDTSGSMTSAGKIAYARAAGEELVGALRPEDRFALIAFDDRARVLLPGTPFDGDVDRLRAAVRTLEPGGSTNLSAGLEAGFAQLGDDDRLRRVVVVSDGQANRGIVAPDALRGMATTFAARGVTVSALGLGADYNELVLEGLADAGGGSYAYVEDPAQLPQVVSRELDQAATVVAKDLRVRVRLGEGVVATAVHGWDYTSHGDGLEVYAGELAAGQQKKVVVELRVDGDRAGDALAVADASAQYVATRDGGTHIATVASRATLVDSVAAVSASADDVARSAATQAVAGTYAKRSAAAFRAGDAVAAQREVQRSKSLLLQVIGTIGTLEKAEADKLQDALEQVEGLEALGYVEASAAPAAAKAASARGRGMSQ